jgi:hypothetical protein
MAIAKTSALGKDQARRDRNFLSRHDDDQSSRIIHTTMPALEV